MVERYCDKKKGGSMFKFNIGQTVYFIRGKKIEAGVIISRKLVEAPNFDSKRNEFDSTPKMFNRNGNRLGMPCQRYEILGEDTKGSTVVVDRKDLFEDQWDISEYFTEQAELIDLKRKTQ